MRNNKNIFTKCDGVKFLLDNDIFEGICHDNIPQKGTLYRKSDKNTQCLFSGSFQCENDILLFKGFVYVETSQFTMQGYHEQIIDIDDIFSNLTSCIFIHNKQIVLCDIQSLENEEITSISLAEYVNRATAEMLTTDEIKILTNKLHKLFGKIKKTRIVK